MGGNYTLGDKDKTFIPTAASISLKNRFLTWKKLLVDEHGMAAKELLDRLIKWKPELAPTEYEVLDVFAPAPCAGERAY